MSKKKKTNKQKKKKNKQKNTLAKITRRANLNLEPFISMRQLNKLDVNYNVEIFINDALFM